MMVMDHSAAPAVVLVVEDEMLLRMRAVDMVEDAGYTSVEAVDADEAVAILESRSDIALMFTDIQMPGSMSGLELALAVHGRWPRIKIILASVAPVPFEAIRAEAALSEKRITPEVIAEAAQIAMDSITPIDDVRGSARYRKYMVRNLTREALTKVWSKLGK